MDLGPIGVTIDGGLEYPFPPLVPVEQHFARARLVEVADRIEHERSKIRSEDIAGKTVAITIGSRGIAGILQITSALVALLKSKGALPFIVPAMGSHGGATAEG